MRGIFYFLADISDGDTACGLLVDEVSKKCLASDNAEWDFLLAAEGWDPHNQFNWVNVVGEDDKLGFLLFNEMCDVIETVFQDAWL
jgi:hypothetical protein